MAGSIALCLLVLVRVANTSVTKLLLPACSRQGSGERLNHMYILYCTICVHVYS
jgi:hypothetical protein